MEKTTNKIQEQYMIAKAYLEALKTEEKELENQYIIDNNIINPDGTEPEYIYCIDDEVIFNKANMEFGAIIEKSGLWGNILTAEAALSTSEEELIKYGLSLAPAKEKKILEKAVKDNYVTREKVINLTLKPDASTVK